MRASKGTLRTSFFQCVTLFKACAPPLICATCKPLADFSSGRNESTMGRYEKPPVDRCHHRLRELLPELPGSLAGARRSAIEVRHNEGSAFTRIPRSAERSAATRVVALDERQHLKRGDWARPGVDASCRPGRSDHLRGLHQHTAGGSAAADLHDARMEERV